MPELTVEDILNNFLIGIPGCGGYNTFVSLNQHEIELYLEDSVKFYAERHGVSEEVILAFENYAKDPRCVANTKTGNRCWNYHTTYLTSPEGFELGVSDRCTIHQR